MMNRERFRKELMGIHAVWWREFKIFQREKSRVGGNMNDPAAIMAVSEMRKLMRMWEELKAWLKKHPNQIHYMGAATIESVVKKMEELEEK